MKHCFLFILVVLLAVKAEATNLPHQAFVAGDYVTAQHIGRESNTASGLTIACRAGLVMGGFYSKDNEATTLLHTAIKDCTAALTIDPLHFDAQMSLAIALSYEGKRTKKTFYPKHARMMLEALVGKHPDNALAYGALAAWHSQVSAAGFFARIVLKASRKQAKQLFEEAFRHGAIDFPLHVEHLKFLAAGSKAERQQALIAAKALVETPVSTSFDKLLQERCKTILTALKTGKKKEIKIAINAASAFNTAEGWKDEEAYPEKLVPLMLTQ